MSITKTILEPGDEQQLVKKYDEVSIEYTAGWVFQEDGPDEKGREFDSSAKRGDSIVVIGMGRVLKGWDKGILGDYKPTDPNEQVGPMALNEKARFKFSPSFGYGANGFPGQVPKNATLI
ncbi:peptidyl-prolyl cis-trans isomerase [Lizonia empirigonia]|nr:peptidyl-prolyl cis-trans isomerase [Lizonia empirigonia]